MPAYHQMGHDSWNLVAEAALEGYAGLILSPVNDGPGDVQARLGGLRIPGSLEMVLDPQLYKPSSDRGALASWPHFDADVDTVELGDNRWWDERGKALCECATTIGVEAICSPAMLPKVFDDDYYQFSADVAARLQPLASAKKLDLLVTAIVHLPDLTKQGRAEAIASILTSVDVSRVYLVFYDDLYPRDQRTDFQMLANAGRLIRLLQQAGSRVLTAFSGFDMILWKAAGSADVASGKFFNLRRFVPGRWDDPEEGGRVVPYWTDGGFVTWLREDDLRLLDMHGLVDRTCAATNPYAAEILRIIDSGKKDAWVALG